MINRTTACHSYTPADGHRLAHDPFNAIVGPRPIGWIGSVDQAGRVNLAPYSFFNAFNYHPPIIGFASIGEKDTLANLRETRVFTWNLATRTLAAAMNETSAPLPRGEDEAARAGLAMVPSDIIAAPRVADSPVQFECRVTQFLRLLGADGGSTPAEMAFGEVVRVHIRADLVRDGHYNAYAPGVILRAGGPADYIEVDPGAVFRITRPQ
jgi:flavin reductase (DIM6/NTAB) family NADH-FMN oxidoreductase RutF